MSRFSPSTLGALILTGGASARMGRDKAEIDWGGARAVDLVVAIAQAAGADPVLTVGARDYGHANVREDQPDCGPVAGILAGADMLRAAGIERALVLACDAPTIRVEDLANLLNSPAPGAVFDDLHLPLVVDIDRLPSEGANRSMKQLIAETGLRLLAPATDAVARLRGANTPEELAGLRGAGK